MSGSEDNLGMKEEVIDPDPPDCSNLHLLADVAIKDYEEEEEKRQRELMERHYRRHYPMLNRRQQRPQKLPMQVAVRPPQPPVLEPPNQNNFLPAILKVNDDNNLVKTATASTPVVGCSSSSTLTKFSAEPKVFVPKEQPLSMPKANGSSITKPVDLASTEKLFKKISINDDSPPIATKPVGPTPTKNFSPDNNADASCSFSRKNVVDSTENFSKRITDFGSCSTQPVGSTKNGCKNITDCSYTDAKAVGSTTNGFKNINDSGNCSYVDAKFVGPTKNGFKNISSAWTGNYSMYTADAKPPRDFHLAKSSSSGTQNSLVIKLPVKRKSCDAEATSSKENHQKMQLPPDKDIPEGNKILKIKGTINAVALVPELPLRSKNKIMEIGGIEIQFIIRKPLYPSDMLKSQGRLSMPMKKIRTEFLKPEEKITLSTRNGEMLEAINALLIEPSLRVTYIRFKKWNMAKRSGVISSNYLLASPWNEVRRRNTEFRVGREIGIWSFRVNEELGFCIVVL